MEQPIIITSLAELTAVLANSPKVHGTAPLLFQNAKGTIYYLGLGYIKAMLEEANKLYPSIIYQFILDCEDDPAIVQEALALGFTRIIFKGHITEKTRLQEIAQFYQAQIL